MKLSIEELKKNNIVYVTIDGGPHYSVVREITNESVKLADPSLGNIDMSREKFAEVYSGYALVINDPNNSTQVNGTTDQANNQTNQINGNTTSSESVTDTTNINSTKVHSDNRTLTDEEMQSVKGKLWVKVQHYGGHWTWIQMYVREYVVTKRYRGKPSKVELRRVLRWVYAYVTEWHYDWVWEWSWNGSLTRPLEC
ncbi:MAG: hypothetical protein FJ150_04840 [Euryarchaeota archaeon]|nr:hypothetical protein [Euryarchaeota archaeon]